MIGLTFGTAQFESDSSLVISHDEFSEDNGIDAWWATDLTDFAGESSSIRETLTFLVDCIKNITYIS